MATQQPVVALSGAELPPHHFQPERAQHSECQGHTGSLQIARIKKKMVGRNSPHDLVGGFLLSLGLKPFISCKKSEVRCSHVRMKLAWVGFLSQCRVGCSAHAEQHSSVQRGLVGSPKHSINAGLYQS